jgi:ActR/RegA family two-component response regulator
LVEVEKFEVKSRDVQTGPAGDTVNHTHHVLIVEDDYAFRWSLAMRCQKRRIEADVAETVTEARDLIQKTPHYCGVVLDLRMGQTESTPLLDTLAEQPSQPNVVIVTGYPDVWERVKNTRNTTLVSTAIFKPADVDDVIDTALKACGT